MKKMKHGGKVHKRMQVGGKVMDPSFAAAAAANPANAPVRGAGPISGSQDVGGRGMPIRGGGRMGAGPISGAQDVGGRGMPVRGPKTGVRPSDGKPANPRVTYGPRGPRPKGYGPNDGGPSSVGPRGLGPKGYGLNDGGPRPMGPRITPVDVTGMPVGGPKTGFNPADGKPANPRVTYGANSPSGAPVDQPKRPPTFVVVDEKPPFDYENDPGTVGGRRAMGDLQGLEGLDQLIAARGAISPMNMGPSPSLKKGGSVKSKAMRGGGLARKGVGMALAKGGLARRAGGCAKRGFGKGKIV